MLWDERQQCFNKSSTITFMSRLGLAVNDSNILSFECPGSGIHVIRWVDDFNNRSDLSAVERGVIIAMQTFFHSFTRASTQFYRAITKFCSQEILVGWCINMHRFDFCSKRGFQHMTSTTFFDFLIPSKMRVLFVRKSGVFIYPSLSAQMSYKRSPPKALKNAGWRISEWGRM